MENVSFYISVCLNFLCFIVNEALVYLVVVIVWVFMFFLSFFLFLGRYFSCILPAYLGAPLCVLMKPLIKKNCVGFYSVKLFESLF
jgi:hypothetical protein